jgi:SanA protein
MIKKILINSTKIIIIVLVATTIVNLFMIGYASKYIDKADMLKSKVILVLGASVYGNGDLSYMLRDRMDKAIELYKSNEAYKLLLSGDNGSVNYDEVSAMKKYALEKDIPKEDIYLDHAGFSTYESMYRARDIFMIDNVIIVTQQYHLYRSIFIAKVLGLEAYGVSAVKYNYSGTLYRNLREYLARAKDYIYCLLKPKPTFLGDKIPILESSLVAK